MSYFTRFWNQSKCGRTAVGASLPILLAVVGCSTGARSGDPDAAAPTTSAPDAAPVELCDNGVDDDGNGEVDEDCPCTLGETRPCYDGDESVAGVGACTLGVQTCEGVPSDDDELDTTAWGSCDGSGQPSTTGEECNDIDDDCDGSVDEDCEAVPYGSCGERCNGTRRVLYNDQHDRWIQVISCSPERYDLLMGDSAAGPFFKIGDTNNHGQDHCELVNPGFTMTVDGDETSGNCPTCQVDGAGSISGIPELLGTPMYYRDLFGQPFTFTSSADHPGIHTTCWYECGVNL